MIEASSTRSSHHTPPPGADERLRRTTDRFSPVTEMSGQQVEREQRVTPLELFFDLVVVLHYREDRIEVRQARP